MAWQYKVLGMNVNENNVKELEQELNSLGNDDWELVSASQTEQNVESMLFVLKRPKPAEPTPEEEPIDLKNAPYFYTPLKFD